MEGHNTSLSSLTGRTREWRAHRRNQMITEDLNYTKRGIHHVQVWKEIRHTDKQQTKEKTTNLGRCL